MMQASDLFNPESVVVMYRYETTSKVLVSLFLYSKSPKTIKVQKRNNCQNIDVTSVDQL